MDGEYQLVKGEGGEINFLAYIICYVTEDNQNFFIPLIFLLIWKKCTLTLKAKEPLYNIM